MEFDVTPDEIRSIISEHGGYGAIRVYGITDGQIVPIKSEYHLTRFDYSRTYAVTNNGMPPIRKA